MKDHGYTEPGVRVYELDVYEKVPVVGSTAHCHLNKTIRKDKRIVFHVAACVHGIIKSKCPKTYNTSISLLLQIK